MKMSCWFWILGRDFFQRDNFPHCSFYLVGFFSHSLIFRILALLVRLGLLIGLLLDSLPLMGVGFHILFTKSAGRNSDGESNLPHRVSGFPLFGGFVTSLLLCCLADTFIQYMMQTSSSILIVLVRSLLYDI